MKAMERAIEMSYRNGEWAAQIHRNRIVIRSLLIINSRVKNSGSSGF